MANETGVVMNKLAMLLLAGGLALSVGITQVARATTLTVNSTADIVADDGQCTLREAVFAANTDLASGEMPGECPAGSGADTIVFDRCIERSLPSIALTSGSYRLQATSPSLVWAGTS